MPAVIRFNTLIDLNTNRKILLLSLIRAIESFGLSFLIVIIPIYVSGDQISDISALGDTILGLEITVELLIGIAISTTALVSSIGQPIGGSLSDRWNKRKIFIIAGFSILSVTVPLYLIVETYRDVLILRAAQGIGGALLVPAVASMVNIESIDGAKGENFGIYNTLRLIGFGIGPAVAGGIISLGPYNLIFTTLTGIEAAFWITVVAAVISLLSVLIFIEESTLEERPDEDDTKLLNVIRTDKFKYILILALTQFLLAASIAIFITLENAVIERFNQSTFMFGVQFSAAVLANTLTQAPIGRLSDRRGRKPIILLGFLILIPSVVAQGFVTTSYQMLFARLIQGVSVALVFAPSLALVGELAEDKNSGLFLSTLTGSFGLGIAVAPTASGVLYSIGGFTTPFIYAGVAALLGLILVYIFVPDE